MTCDVNTPVAGGFLDIEAFDVSPAAPGLFREAWHISTGPDDDSTKRGCLSKARGAKKTIPIGNFDLTFGYTVCILDPDSVVDECFLELE